MELLPVELRRNILEKVDFRSLKALRLTSRIWASLGEDYFIFSTFNTLPHRPDIQRLTSVSQHPVFSQKIEHIIMNHGEVNEYHARHNTYFLQYSVDPDARAESQTSTWRAYADLKDKKDLFLNDGYEAESQLESNFRRLPNLQSISVTLMTCPFQDEDQPDLLRDIWQIPSTRLLPRVATTERFTTMLEAVARTSSSHNITSLSHDRLPFEFFAQKLTIITSLSKAFKSLTSLNFALDYSDMPNNLHTVKGLDNLSQCLRETTTLKALNLAIQGRRKIDIGYLLATFEAHKHVFTHLEKLTLQGIAANEDNLGYFLVQQPSLKMLQLGGIGVRARHQPPNGGILLTEGTFNDLFQTIDEEMKLESFQVLGDLVGVESNERWVLEQLEDVKNLREYVID